MTRPEQEYIQRVRDEHYAAADDPAKSPAERERDKYAAELLDDLLTGLYEVHCEQIRRKHNLG